jgi:hypothetical protein
MKEALADAPDGPISLIDPDARAMATSVRRSGLVGYNAQVAVDTDTHLIAIHDVTNQGFDRHPLGPVATSAKMALGDDLHVIVDKTGFGRRGRGRWNCASRSSGRQLLPGLPGAAADGREGAVAARIAALLQLAQKPVCPTGPAKP